MPRRRSTIKPAATTANDLPSKTLELESRVARLEVVIKDLQSVCEEGFKRAVAVQAQLDHLAARLSHI